MELRLHGGQLELGGHQVALGRGDRGLGVGELELAAEALGVARIGELELGARRGHRLGRGSDVGAVRDDLGARQVELRGQRDQQRIARSRS